MDTIYKFPLKIEDVQIIDMPNDAQILTVQMQDGVPCLWAKVDPNKRMRPYAFRIFGTGHPIPDNFRGVYIGTFQSKGGILVFHVWVI